MKKLVTLSVSTMRRKPLKHTYLIICRWHTGSVTSHEPIFASHCFFFLLFIYWRFQFSINVFLSNGALGRRNTFWFSFMREIPRKYNVVSVVCWRSVYSFRYELNFELPSPIFYQSVDYVKVTNIQIYTGKRSSEANFR